MSSSTTRNLNAGAFSIERLEVSRFGPTALCVLNCVVGRGRGRGGCCRRDPDAVNPRPVVALFRLYGQAHFLAQRPADKTPATVGLPGRGRHDFGERGTLGPAQQFEDGTGLAAGADTRSE